MCEKLCSTVLELHYHHMQCHTCEEMSYKIIGLSGFEILNNPQFLQNGELIDYKEINYTSQGKDISNTTNMPILTADAIKQEKQEPLILGHDKENCLANCSLFIPWEQQLNKHIIVNDADFIKSTIGLCRDLQFIKHKRTKKRLHNLEVKTNANQLDPCTKNTVPETKEENVAHTTSTSDCAAFNCNNLVENCILPNPQICSEEITELDDEHDTEENKSALSLIKLGLQENVLQYGTDNTNLWNNMCDIDTDIENIISNNNGRNLAALIFASNLFQISCKDEIETTDMSNHAENF